MLILTRRPGEGIVIPQDVEGKLAEIHIKILHNRGDYVRIGIDAPRSIDLYRSEIYRKILEEANEKNPDWVTPEWLLTGIRGADILPKEEELENIGNALTIHDIHRIARKHEK